MKKLLAVSGFIFVFTFNGLAQIPTGSYVLKQIDKTLFWIRR